MAGHPLFMLAMLGTKQWRNDGVMQGARRPLPWQSQAVTQDPGSQFFIPAVSFEQSDGGVLAAELPVSPTTDQFSHRPDIPCIASVSQAAQIPVVLNRRQHRIMVEG